MAGWCSTCPPGLPGPSLLSCFPDDWPEPTLAYAVIPSQAHHFAFPFVELHEIPVGPFFQPVEVPLNGTTTISCISCSSWFCATCELSGEALCPTAQVIDGDIQHHWPQGQTPEDTISDWSPAVLCASDHNPLSSAVQRVFSPPHCPYT